MIVFDTTLVSEAIKENCDENVTAWLSRLDSEDMATTTVNLAEALSGISVLPDGKRKAHLKTITEAYVAAAFRQNILSFDAQSATVFAELLANMKLRGKAISFPDCQIAAIALVNNCAVATRDIQPFLNAGLSVINPWTDE